MSNYVVLQHGSTKIDCTITRFVSRIALFCSGSVDAEIASVGGDVQYTFNSYLDVQVEPPDQLGALVKDPITDGIAMYSNLFQRLDSCR